MDGVTDPGKINDWNSRIIEEFRANGGKVSGSFEGVPLLLLHHVGRKSGADRINPVAYQAVGGSWAIFASKAGADDNPDWYHNLLAQPEVSIEVGTDTVPVRARNLTGDERSTVWEKQKRDNSGFAEYEAKTSRTIPVVLLEPR